MSAYVKNITHTLENADGGTLRTGCIRFKQGRIRWHTLAYGEAETCFLSMLSKNFARNRTYGLYDKHTLGTR